MSGAAALERKVARQVGNYVSGSVYAAIRPRLSGVLRRTVCSLQLLLAVNMDHWSHVKEKLLAKWETM